MKSARPSVRYARLAVDLEDVRLGVYHSFARTGRAPSHDALAGQLGVGGEEIAEALRTLHEQRHVVLDAEAGIVMAHPFASVPLGFAAMGSSTLWWGGCAWDSFALPHLLEDEPSVLVSTRCPACDGAHAWVVDRDGPPRGTQVARFATPVSRMWDDVVETCSNQRLFCGPACVGEWVARTGGEPGYVMDLPTLWRLAAGWYEGRLDRGYSRREPEEAKEYFRSVGLTGPFWGVE
jgi:hypothetical protein